MKKRALLTCASTVLFGAITAAPASAAHGPRVSLSIPHSVDAGKPIPVSYKSSSASRDKLVLQRQEGTKHVWRTVLKLGGHRGKAQAPKLKIGSYAVRIAALNARNQVVATQRHSVKVYGTVTFSRLFQQSTQTYTTPDRTFPYVFDFYDGSVDYTAISVEHSPCRSVHLNFIPGTDDGNEVVTDPSSATASIVQESRDPVRKAVAPQTVGTLNARVVPGESWSVNVAEPEDGGRLLTWYINGTATCDRTKIQSWSSD